MTVTIPPETERKAIARRLPKGWHVDIDGADGQRIQTPTGMSIIWSTAIESDGREWMHISAARPDRLPSYGDMASVKAVVAGDDRYGYTVMAPHDKHVNIHSHCLHIWVPLDQGDLPLPDFTRGGRSI